VRLADFQFQHVGAAAMRPVHEQPGNRLARFLLSGSGGEFKHFAAIERVLEENRLGGGRRRLFGGWRGCRRRGLYHRGGDRRRLGR